MLDIIRTTILTSFQLSQRMILLINQKIIKY